jgi:hypothetical protein
MKVSHVQGGDTSMRRFRPVFILLALVLTIHAISADDLCPCIPLTHLWTVKTCNDWNCANTELLLGNGDPQVFAVPVGLTDGRWLVMRRFVSGSAVADPNDPFQLEQFPKMNDGFSRFATIDQQQKPLLMTSPDGQVLVASMKPSGNTRRHAATH